jgi:PAS domain S-box-containing protein
MNNMGVRRTQSELEHSDRDLTDELAEINSALAGKTQELERIEERFQHREWAASQILWKAGPDRRVEGIQPGWEAFTGQSRDEWNRAVDEKRPLLLEHRARGRDGIYRLFSIKAFPVLNEDDTIREWVGVHNDITERRQREEEVLAQEEKFRFLCESMPQIVWRLRADGWREYCNQRWFDYTGMTLQQTLGWGWLAAMHPDDLPNFRRGWQQATDTGELFQSEYRLKRGDGRYHWHLSRALPLKDKQGVIVQWFGTCTDIDHYKRAESENLRLRADLEDRVLQRTSELESANLELLRSSRKLELSNGMLQNFASVAAHDLQEPLRKIQAFGDRLNVGYRAALDEKGLDYLRRMLNATGRMQTLIQDLLALSRVTSEGRPSVPVDLARLTREVLADLDERVSENKARVEIGDLPVIEGDPGQIRQLLQNLIGNSLKFHKKDEAPIIRVSAATAGDGACRLVVEDNGIGFDEKYLDRIFTVFQRLHTRAEYDGTGVGLAICRQIAQAHGGDITAKSAPNHGATFIVTLPGRAATVAEWDSRMLPRAGDGLKLNSAAVSPGRGLMNASSDSTSVTPAAARIPALAASGARSMIVLQADDDDDYRMLTADAFDAARLADNRLLCVNDGEELMDYLYRRGKFAPPAAAPRPGLILLDLNMPRMDGRDALREIKADPELRSIAVVVLTTSETPEDIERLYNLGAASYVSKPVTYAGLVKAMKVVGEYWFQIVKLPGRKDAV